MWQYISTSYLQGRSRSGSQCHHLGCCSGKKAPLSVEEIQEEKTKCLKLCLWQFFRCKCLFIAALFELFITHTNPWVSVSVKPSTELESHHVWGDLFSICLTHNPDCTFISVFSWPTNVFSHYSCSLILIAVALLASLHFLHLLPLIKSDAFSCWERQNTHHYGWRVVDHGGAGMFSDRLARCADIYQTTDYRHTNGREPKDTTVGLWQVFC